MNREMKLKGTTAKRVLHKSNGANDVIYYLPRFREYLLVSFPYIDSNDEKLASQEEVLHVGTLLECETLVQEREVNNSLGEYI